MTKDLLQEVGASRPTQPESAPCGAPASFNSASLKASAPATPSTSSTGPTPPPTFASYVSYHFGALKFTGSTQEEANEKAQRYCSGPNPNWLGRLWGNPS